MHSGRIDIFDEVLVACLCALGSYSTTSLLAEVTERSTLDVAQVAHGDNHGVIGIEILGIEFVLGRNNLGTAIVAILLLDLLQLVLHHLSAQRVVGENAVEVVYLLHQLVVFIVQLVDAEAGQL